MLSRVGASPSPHTFVFCFMKMTMVTKIRLPFLLDMSERAYILGECAYAIRSRTTHVSPNIDHSKTCLKRPLKKKTKNGFQDRLSLNAFQKYCRMLSPREHSAILLAFI